GDGPALRADVLGGEARVGAQVGARAQARLGVGAKVDVVLDDERLRSERVGAAPASTAAPAASAPGNGPGAIASDHGGERELVSIVGVGVAVQAPDDHVERGRARGADEQRAVAVEIEAW